jgi:hypothetical protein
VHRAMRLATILGTDAGQGPLEAASESGLAVWRLTPPRGYNPSRPRY